MRSADHMQHELFCTISLEALVPTDHPLRAIRRLADRALERMEPAFAKLYSTTGRPGVPPEQLLRALLLEVLYGYRSERRLVEELGYNFALRWFVGLGVSQSPWDVTVFTKNRERFLNADLAQHWLQAVVLEAHQAKLLDEDHFSVDGTLIQAWASERSYRPKANPPARGSGRHGKLLKRDVMESSTDPEARMYRKSAHDSFRLSYQGHVAMEHAHGLIVASTLTPCSTRAEREAAASLLHRIRGWRAAVRNRTHASSWQPTVTADTAYHEQDFVERARELGFEPHLPAWQRRPRPDLIGDQVRSSDLYRQNRQRRKWVERCFGWLKQAAGQRQTHFRGVRRVAWGFDFAVGVYNLVRLTKLLAQN